MSIRRKLLAIAAVSTLTAAAAVPAMAFENEIHGAFGVRAVNSNYLGYQVNGSGTGYLLGGNAGAGSGAVGSALVARADSTLTENFIDQRARIFYSAKASDNLKLVTGFELDATWGKSSYAVDRNNGGAALGADNTNLETNWFYLDFNVPSTKVNVKVGLQGLNDAYKNLIVGGGADAAGLVVSAPVGPATLTAGWFRLDDHVATPSYVGGSAVAGFIPGASTSANANFSDGK